MRTARRTSPERQLDVDTGAVSIAVAPRMVGRALFGALALLTIAHLVFAINQAHIGLDFFGSTLLWVIFDMQGEVTVPTWFSSSLLLTSSLLFGAVALVKRRTADRYLPHWAGLAVIFLGLSIDEAADIHGAVSYKIQSTYDTSGVMAYPWILPAAILTVAVGIIYLRFLRQLPDPFRRRLILAAGLFICGALVLEAVEAAYDTAVGGDDLAYIVMVAIEETLEKAGVIVLITALLSYLGSITGELRLTFAPDE